MSAKFCRKCGTPLKQGNKFCCECGTPIVTVTIAATEAKVAEINRQRASSVKSKGKSKNTGKKLLAFFLACVLTFMLFVQPGVLRHKTDTTGNDSHIADNSGHNIPITAFGTTIPDKLNSEEIASGMLTLDNATITGEGVTVTVEPGFLGEDRAIEVSKITDNVEYSFDGEEAVPLSMYEVNIDGIHEGSMITIELPMDRSTASLYGAGYVDGETHRLKPALGTYDSETGILTIHTTHLSKFCGIPIKNENTRKAALAYINAYDYLGDETIDDYNFLMSLLETSMESGGNIECGISLLDTLSLAQGGASVMTDLANAPFASGVSSIAEGSGQYIYMTGNQGTIGEIMNSNWGRSGTWSTAPEWGKSVTRVEGYDETLKTVYPSKVVEKLGSTLTNAGRILTLYKITKSIVNEGFTSASAATDIYKWVSTEMLGAYVKYGSYTAGLGVYMVGVGALAWAIDYTVATLQAGREEVFVHGYTRYYGGEGHRTDDDWIKIFKDIMKSGGGQAEFEAEIDSYVNQFWAEADKMSVDYYENILSDDDKAAWGISTAQGLTPEIRKKVSENYKSRLMTKRMPTIFEKLANENKYEMLEKYQANIDLLSKQWNQTVTVSIASSDAPSNDKDSSYYAGCKVRFKDLKNKVNDPSAWECVLNREGSGVLSFTLLSHMLSNAGTELEIVRVEDGEEEVIATKTFEFKTEDGYDYSRLFAVVVLEAAQEEEELEEFPGISEELELENMLGEKWITDTASFELEPDGNFTLTVPHQYRDYMFYEIASIENLEILNLDMNEIVIEGNLATGSVTSDSDGLHITSNNIGMQEDWKVTRQENHIYYPNSESSLILSYDVTTILHMIPQFVNSAGQVYTSSIELSVSEKDGGGVLTVDVSAMLEKDLTSISKEGDTDHEKDTIQSHIIAHASIDKETVKQFNSYFK